MIIDNARRHQDQPRNKQQQQNVLKVVEKCSKRKWKPFDDVQTSVKLFFSNNSILNKRGKRENNQMKPEGPVLARKFKRLNNNQNIHRRKTDATTWPVGR